MLQAVSSELAARLERSPRLAADAPNMQRTGTVLIAHYLHPDRLPADQRWSRKHEHTQRRMCERFAIPVIGGVEPQAAADHPPPAGYPLAEWLAARIEQARTEQPSGSNPPGLVFPSPHGKHWRSSIFNRNVLKHAYLETGWRDADGNDSWTWHSLRHVFRTAALFTWKLDVTDVSRIAGHANYRIRLDMYVGSTAGILDRARAATE